MGEKEIKRVNFFDGQFLKEAEFIDEQYYHLHMRRRLNYILFENSGVIEINDDLKLVTDTNDPSNKEFKVNPGMAISRNDDDKECKEIILMEQVEKKLSTEGISSGETAYVTIHYEEELVIDPPSGGDVLDVATRVKEKTVITVHSSNPTGPAPNDEEYILLGTIIFDTMEVEDSVNDLKRQVAKIRSTLLEAGPGPGVPSISGISVNSGSQDSTFNSEISGANLDGTTNVAFSGTGVTAEIRPGGTSTNIPITITIVHGATPGSRTFTVTTPRGSADSTGVAGAEFEVEALPVEVKNFSPRSVVPGQTDFGIRGSNLHKPNLNNGDKAEGTTVRFVEPADETNVLAETPEDDIFVNDLPSGKQRIRVTIPDASNFGSPAPGTLEVKVQVSFGGSDGTSENTLDIIFT